MSVDYNEIRAENERRYGTDIGRIGPMLLADRYDDRTHFIYEILQNAEDALARRSSWEGSRAVSFHLTEAALEVRHFGQPFNEPDVRGICGIAESTKELTGIGRFGIGFKSVYAFTDRPQIHSGTQDFAIESYVWPVAVQPVRRDPEETVILMPLSTGLGQGHAEISSGLGRLGASALLFLREIEEVRWSVEGGREGVYLRDAKEVATGVRRVTVVGQEIGQPDVAEEWLIFSRELTTSQSVPAGRAEIAWSVSMGEPGGGVRRSDRSTLVVYFPTAVETHLGFLIQGPYRTTPSRDNVPQRDAWNQHCISETASLVTEALRWLRDHDLLDVGALRCLPLDRSKFPAGSMFAPLFDATKAALASEPLLPRVGSGHVAAGASRLARTRELRELFSPAQLGALLAAEGPLDWLSADFSQDRNADLRQYLMQELGFTELTAETLLPKLDARFLAEQSDEWIRRLYEFLSAQPALRARAMGLPLVRLRDGSHVQAARPGGVQAFLPGAAETDFPTVRPEVCSSEASLAFLMMLGLTEPDVVDDVIRNVLPKYRGDGRATVVTNYATDIQRILAASATNLIAQREKLLTALRATPFVMCVDAEDGSEGLAKAADLYLATDRLRELFAGTKQVLFVDGSFECLRGEETRSLLEACGATRHLQPVPSGDHLTEDELREIRRRAGLERATWESSATDLTLRGLGPLLELLPTLGPEAQRRRAALLWESLIDVESRRGAGAFVGKYSWGFSTQSRAETFQAGFVRRLNEAAWVPDANGQLRPPAFVLFESLAWKAHPFLLSEIHFKPPVIDQLAKEAGFEPGVLDLLRQHGLTSVADLVSRLGVPEGARPGGSGADPETVDQAIASLLGDSPSPTPAMPDPSGAEPSNPRGGGGGDSLSGGRGGAERVDGVSSGHPGGDGRDRASPRRTPGGVGGRPFVSYVAAHPSDEDPDPDGLDQEARMALEGRAIALILARWTNWQRTPTHNPGYDLVELDADAPVRWCEVKAMTGTLRDRPVGLSRTQFDCARQHGDSYWLYVVERAADENARIVRIQNPAGNVRTFTFDSGWIGIASVDAEQETPED